LGYFAQSENTKLLPMSEYAAVRIPLFSFAFFVPFVEIRTERPTLASVWVRPGIVFTCVPFIAPPAESLAVVDVESSSMCQTAK
jgi:hypothetical protein